MCVCLSKREKECECGCECVSLRDRCMFHVFKSEMCEEEVECSSARVHLNFCIKVSLEKHTGWSSKGWHNYDGARLLIRTTIRS